MQTQTAVSLTQTGHFFTDQKEEVYFTVNMTLPRVGEIKVRCNASRYMARMWPSNGEGEGRNDWTQWRVIRDSYEPIPGVGEKGVQIIRDTIEAPVLAWLAGSEYAPSKRREIARFIARTASERYGTDSAKRYLVTYKDELTSEDFERLTKGVEYLDLGAKLLNP